MCVRAERQILNYKNMAGDGTKQEEIEITEKERERANIFSRHLLPGGV